MADTLRIVHCFRSPVGGIFRHVRDLTEAQVAAGHLVGIVCDSTTGGDFEEHLFEQMKGRMALGIHRTPMQRHVGPGDLASAWRTFGIIKELRPDVLHGHGAKGGAYARLFGSLLRVSRSRVARVYSPHGGSLHYDETTVAGKLFFALERFMARFTDYLLFVSDYERQTYRRKVGEPPTPNNLVHNGLRAAEFEPVRTEPNAADVLYIGMMRDLKGPDIFIDALVLAGTRLGRPLKAVMVGDGDDLPRYHAQVKRLGLEGHVRFLPPMPARKAFALAELVVVPSRAEAMPYIVLETLAAGKSMIATAVGGIPEILGAGSPALIRPDPRELGDKMSAALADPKAYGALMPDTADLKARFGADVMAAAIETAYFAALKR
ncbi:MULTISPECIES: glycosyltransferase family 4 protein [unclassified Mesorhizobium]|uniref:glycosyltransferase family 4 protein n=1 Tax=unclassified Mesorhizobium TaxID=325217 RepID=UPI000FD3638D|nr:MULTISPECIES: glycosyltransferase family 4 protein [unclassified Mesorhizobium]RUU97246.1 glycosyltransferase family 1 protein [Mesorhizobium sp. M6A.T.Cr.TU.017.01.1.1]RVB76627.1 glycosyltransferase family 1 protein [Mesorhizobium sp. M6A.T.Cr.TU.014.01.1.1]RWN68748.1 MAG: glycosyltransferase family 1 protein [Mesorhizobium sp.]RWP80478.1 MAG: glycosyltransferase family 1 protein [Mesorhizobium sp.]RWP96222.1 MAG: glycosyltransferase family 1 protein [Mesorhizobium sp.]